MPYSVFLSSIVLIAIFSLAAMYENELVMTERLIEQIHVESIVQMVEVDIKHELMNNNWDAIGQDVFIYPYGSVQITEVTVDDYIDIRLIINTKSYRYTRYLAFVPE